MFPYSKPFSSSKSEVAKTSQQTMELVVNLNINHEKQILKALVEAGAAVFLKHIPHSHSSKSII
jgi:hypothetical protein